MILLMAFKIIVFTNINITIITVPDDYPTIEDAIANAPPGSTIFVRKGVYNINETIYIRKPLKIVGEHHETIINGSSNIDSIIVIEQATNVSITGFTFINSNTQVMVNGSSYIFIYDNIFKNGNKYAISVGSHYSTPSLRVFIEYNRVMGEGYLAAIVLGSGKEHVVKGNYIEVYGNGVSIVEAYDSVIRDNRFVDCGLVFYNTSTYNNIVVNNTVNSKPLVYLEKARNKVVTGDIGQVVAIDCINITIENTVLSNVDYPLILINTSLSYIANNIVAYAYTGVRLELSNNNTFNNNTIVYCREEAIELSYSNYNVFLNNSISDNGVGIVVKHSSYNRFYLNSFVDNGVQAIVNNKHVNLWDNGSYGNYWSDYSGVDGNNDGIGDQPYVIGINNIDHYPLINLVRTVDLDFLTRNRSGNGIYVEEEIIYIQGIQPVHEPICVHALIIVSLIVLMLLRKLGKKFS